MPSAAVELDEGDFLGDPYEVRGYFGLEEDLLAASHLTDGGTVKSSELRRVRLGIAARWREDWVFAVSGTTGRRGSLRDLWVEYRGWPVRVTIGRFPEPFGLGGALGAFDALVPTRTSASLMGPEYAAGAGLNFRGERWSVSTGAFTRAAGPTLSGRYPEDAASARATWRPWVTDQGYLHLGASLSQRRFDPGVGVQIFGSSEAPLTRGFSPRSTLQTQTDSYRLAGVESIARWQTAVLLAEEVQARVDAGGPTWSAHYVEAGWCLTGERRAYSTRYGTIGGITPNEPVDLGGLGAWEIAARWSAADFSAGGGDRGLAKSIALNWYLMDPVRASLVLQQIHRDRPETGPRDVSLAVVQLQLSL